MGFMPSDLEYKQQARVVAETMNKCGMRAHLRTGNLLTGQLYVAFDLFPKTAPVKINVDGTMTELATTPGTLDELQTKLSNIVSKIDKVPFEQIGLDLRSSMAALDKMLNNADKLMSRVNGDVVPQFATALQDAHQPLQAANDTLAPNAPLQQDTRRMMQELTRSAASLRGLTDYLERHPEALVRERRIRRNHEQFSHSVCRLRD
ncbi:paraquat-inducible protein B [Collimonas sp. OK607]|nr:paraquat-inducible protein B [Collimonas sp. OK607]